jgi:hypothetical protein
LERFCHIPDLICYQFTPTAATVTNKLMVDG